MVEISYFTIGAVAAVLILGAVAIYIYMRKKNSFFQYDIPKVDVPKVDVPKEKVNVPKQPTGDLVLFYADWCPHCHHMMNDWLKAKEMLTQSGKVNVLSFESKDPEVSKHTIPGFPCIRYYPLGVSKIENYVEYKGPRTSDEMVQFVIKQ